MELVWFTSRLASALSHRRRSPLYGGVQRGNGYAAHGGWVGIETQARPPQGLLNVLRGLQRGPLSSIEEGHCSAAVAFIQYSNEVGHKRLKVSRVCARIHQSRRGRQKKR